MPGKTFVASIGGASYAVIVVCSILFGKRIPDAPAARAPSAPEPVGAAVGKYGSAGTLHLPGTLVLVGIFFLSFVLYYYVNWKYLAQIWPLR